MKDIQFHPSIAQHDYQVKLRKIISLLKKSQQVKCSVIFRGREMAHLLLGEQLISDLIADLLEAGQPVHAPRLLGNRMSVTFNPRKVS